jgi:GGDEF domain-containing protein
VPARVGGDEFAVVSGVHESADAIDIAGRIRGAGGPIVVGNRELRVTSSVGVAFSDEAGTVD